MDDWICEACDGKYSHDDSDDFAMRGAECGTCTCYICENCLGPPCFDCEYKGKIGDHAQGRKPEPGACEDCFETCDGCGEAFHKNGIPSGFPVYTGTSCLSVHLQNCSRRSRLQRALALEDKAVERKEEELREAKVLQASANACVALLEGELEIVKAVREQAAREFEAVNSPSKEAEITSASEEGKATKSADDPRDNPEGGILGKASKEDPGERENVEPPLKKGKADCGTLGKPK